MPQVAAFVAGFFGATAPAIGSAAFGSWVAGVGAAGAVSSFLTTTVAGKLLTSVALSALSRALAPKPKIRTAGIRSESTMTGGTTPASFILGRYATEGQLVAPPMSHGQVGGTPNAYLTYVVELGDIPGQTLDGYMIDGEPVTLGTTPHPDYGLPVLGRHEGYAWIRYYDGTQTVADPMLVDKYGADPDRPWDASMVGAGICYAICTFRLKRDLYSGFPRVRFVMGGIPLYDPRKDDTVGGVGPHRWGDPSTWEPSENTAVQVYNILRGIRLPGGDVWGGEIPAEDLPLSNWFAAMNACDAPVDLATGGSEPAWRSSYEVFAADEPATVVEELLKVCSGQISEVGGVFKIRIGGPGLPVWFFTDEDVNIRASQQFEPFPGIGDTWNGVHASHPDPDALWQSTDAPPRYNASYEAEDGGRRLIADLSLPAAPYAAQVQRVMRAYIEEERRFRRHTLTLAPEAIPLEPLDAVSWSSERNGYAGKVFEVAAISDPLVLSRPEVSLRERDSADYDWQPSYELPVNTPPVTVSQPQPYAIASWSVTPASVPDASGSGRLAAIEVTWAAGADDIESVAWEARLAASGEVVASGVTDYAAGRVLIAQGILSLTDYEVRIRPVSLSGRETAWSIWAAATTGDYRLGVGDLSDSLTSPATPSGLALSTALVADGRAQVSASWAAAANAVQYEVGVTASGGNESVLASGDTTFDLDALPGVPYSIRVRAVSAIGNKSAWTATQTITAASDAVAPATPTGLMATGGFQHIWVEWDGVADADLDHYEVCYKPTNVTPALNPTAPLIRTPATRVAINGLADNTTKYIWVRAVDTSGNRSDWSASVSATTTAETDFTITTDQIAGVVDSTSFASGLTGVEIVSSLPTTGNFEGRQAMLTTDGKLYRYTGGAWTSAVDTADLSGQVQAAQIAGLEASKITGQLTDAQIADISAAKLTGQIVASQIEDNALAHLNGVFTFDANMVGLGASTAYTTTTTFDATDKYSGTHSALLTFASTADPQSSGFGQGHYVVVPDVVALKFAGKRIRVRGYAKQPATNAAAEFAVGYSTSDVGNSGWQRFTPTPSWTAFEFFYDVPAPAKGGFDYLMFWADTSNSGLGVLIDQWEISIVEDLGNAPGQLSDAQIAAISAAKLTGQITSTQITDSAISTPKIAAGAVSTAKIASGAVTANEIASNTITAAEIAAGTITASEIASGTITASEIASGTITANEIASSAITATKIAAGAVTTAKIAAGAVTANEIAANTITAGEIASGAVTTAKITAGAVTTAKIASGAVTANEIAAATITGAEIAADAITTAHIAAGAIKADQIAANAILASKIGILDTTNLIADADYNDPSYWTGDPLVTVAAADPTAWGGSKVAKIEGLGTEFKRLISQPFPVDPAGEELLVSGRISVPNGDGFATVSIQLSVDETFANVTNVWGGFTTTSTTPVQLSKAFTIPPGYSYARLRMYKPANGATQAQFGRIEVRRRNAGELIVDGAITAGHIGANEVITQSANIKDGIITNAKIVDLTADKITVPASGGLNPAIQIGTTGIDLGTVESRAADPAARINAATTQIDPGRITLWGGNLGQLTDWRYGGDWTQIDGGNIAANTISVNKLTVGARGVTVQNVEFSADAATNTVSWTAGGVRHVTDAGGTVFRSVAAGSATYSGSRLYIYFTKGQPNLSVTTSASVAFTDDTVVLATYAGGTDLTVNYGQTIIDGDHIQTGAVQAQHVDTVSFSASGLAIFGGGLQSDDYVAGSAGWQIDKTGNAEFNQLIVRNSLVNGAVSDGGSYWKQVGKKYYHNDVVVKIANGAAPTADALYQISLNTQRRRLGYYSYQTGTDKDGNPTYTTQNYSTRVILEERKKVNGTWQAWTVMFTGAWAINDTWTEEQSIVDRILYDADDVEWRLRVQINYGITSLSTAQNNVRRIGLSVRAVRR